MQIKDRNKIKNDPRKGYEETLDLFYNKERRQASSSKKNKWQEVWGRSTHLRYKNKTLKWCSSDDKKTFEVNKRVASSRKLLEINGWLDKSNEITYEFNEHGFRSVSFETKCKVLFNGCSQTMGIGLPLQMTWAGKVAEELDVPYHSVACAGADWQHVCQRTLYWIPKLKPDFLILKEPPVPRFNWWDMETVTSTAQFTSDELMDCKIRESRPLIDIVSDNNSIWYQYSMQMLIEKCCEDNNVQLLILPNDRMPDDRIAKLTGKSTNRDNDYARDLCHKGPIEHEMVFKKVIENIRKL